MQLPDNPIYHGQLTKRLETWFDASIRRPPPPLLYHYTTAAGLLGILEEAELWATDIRYLNDSREFRHAVDLLNDGLEDLTKTHPQPEARQFAEGVHSLHDVGAEAVMFVSSFTARRDALSQWRGYGRWGTAYALGFNVTDLAALGERQSAALVPCVYELATQRAAINALVEDLFEEFLRTIATKEAIEPMVVFGTCYSSFITIAPHLKDRAFEEEQEWRLLRHVDDEVRDSVFFRAGSTSLIPRTTLRLEGIAVEELLVGPTPSPLLARLAAERLGKHSRVKVGKVEASAVPYREV